MQWNKADSKIVWYLMMCWINVGGNVRQKKWKPQHAMQGVSKIEAVPPRE